MDKNKKVIISVFDEVMNARDFSKLEHFISADFTSPSGMKGAAAFVTNIKSIISAVPDARWHVKHLAAERDEVLVSWIMSGTHKEQFLRIQATGKKVQSEGFGVFTLKDGKVIRSSIQTDRLGFLQQLGVLPDDLSRLGKVQNDTTQVRFIDEFLIPEAAMDKFEARVNINRDYIRQLKGFVNDEVYRRKDENGQTVLITIAVWENETALREAKGAVKRFYQSEGFDPAIFMTSLGITMRRGIFR